MFLEVFIVTVSFVDPLFAAHSPVQYMLDDLFEYEAVDLLPWGAASGLLLWRLCDLRGGA